MNLSSGEIVVKENNGFCITFNANTQSYTVYKDGEFLIGNKYK